MPGNFLKMMPIKDDEVHIWISYPRIICDPLMLDRYYELMSDEERARQQRYKLAKDKHNALITRALARTTLSCYLGIEPKRLIFSKSAKGKPEIIKPPIPLRFNLSHSSNMIVCAVSLKHDIGVDVEDISRNSKIDSIANRFFSEEEIKVLDNLSESDKRNRFFDYWTLKESYLKACGYGLSIPLDCFSFNIKTESDIEISFSKELNDKADDLQFRLFTLDRLHRLAVALRCSANNPYKTRFFYTVPLKDFFEVTLPLADVIACC